MADIFNNFDRQTEVRFMTALEDDQPRGAERIKTLMFTFDDLAKLDSASAQTLMRSVDKDKLAVALKGASETVRQFFLKNMSTRAAKMLTDDMEALGPVRLRDVDDAQSAPRQHSPRISPPRARSRSPRAAATKSWCTDARTSDIVRTHRRPP